MKYKSVAGTGIVSIVSDRAEKKKGLDLIMEHYAGKQKFDYDDRMLAVTEVLRLDVTTLSAKQKT